MSILTVPQKMMNYLFDMDKAFFNIDKFKVNMLDKEWLEALEKLATKRIYLTLEEEEFIKKLAKKL
jgi:hypothetical protein